MQDLPRAAIDIGRFRFTGFHGCESWCRIRIYPRPDGEPPVVIATEDGSNPGTSITNAVELIATDVAHHHHLPALVWIEHYEAAASSDPDPEMLHRTVGRRPTYDRVDFDGLGACFRNPQWSPLTLEQVLALIDERPTLHQRATDFARGVCNSLRRRRPDERDHREATWHSRFHLTSGRGTL